MSSRCNAWRKARANEFLNSEVDERRQLAMRLNACIDARGQSGFSLSSDICVPHCFHSEDCRLNFCENRRRSANAISMVSDAANLSGAIMDFCWMPHAPGPPSQGVGWPRHLYRGWRCFSYRKNKRLFNPVNTLPSLYRAGGGQRMRAINSTERDGERLRGWWIRANRTTPGPHPDSSTSAAAGRRRRRGLSRSLR
jgi:hypothetical protein